MKSILFGLLAASLAGPALAACNSADTRVRCLYVGPNEDTAAETGTEVQDAQDRSGLSARFVTVTRPASGARLGAAGKRIMAKPPVRETPILAVGDTLPDNVLVLMNPLRYGLPRPRDGWTYFTLGRDIYRADIRTRRVLTYVNPHITVRR